MELPSAATLCFLKSAKRNWSRRRQKELFAIGTVLFVTGWIISVYILHLSFVSIEQEPPLFDAPDRVFPTNHVAGHQYHVTGYQFLRKEDSPPNNLDQQQPLVLQSEQFSQRKLLPSPIANSPKRNEPNVLNQWQSLPPLSPLTEHDKTYYTIRINTFHRSEQLLVSLNHHAKCPGVQQIVVIWCDSQDPPPEEIALHYSGKVLIEYHEENTLNERFRVLTPEDGNGRLTKGVLSLDDDLLRPCEALDAGFFKWTRNYDRIVGYDPRTHVVSKKKSNITGKEMMEHETSVIKEEEEEVWEYGFKSQTLSANSYSMVLLRSAFLHVDYLDYYTEFAPRPMYDAVSHNFNCEDIAMSFFVSALTNGKPPLLADRFAVDNMVKLYSEETISGGYDHKAKRDVCVNDFAELLHLKGNNEASLDTINSGRELQNAVLNRRDTKKSVLHYSWGALTDQELHQQTTTFSAAKIEPLVSKEAYETYAANVEVTWMAPREMELMAYLASWNKVNKHEKRWEMMAKMSMEALRRGLIADSPSWKRRWEV